MIHITQEQQMTEPPVLVYQQKWNKGQFKWRFPNTKTCPGSTKWFLKVDLIRADTLLRTQSTFLKWYKINGGKTLTLIWNWTPRLYESWHLHMRKLHMGDQSFSLTWSIPTFIDLRILCLPAGTHSSYTLGTLLKAILETCSADWAPAVARTGEQDLGREVLTLAPCPSKSPRRSEPPWCYTRARGASAASPSSSPPPGWWNSSKLKLLPAEVYVHETVPNYFASMWASSANEDEATNPLQPGITAVFLTLGTINSH